MDLSLRFLVKAISIYFLKKCVLCVSFLIQFFINFVPAVRETQLIHNNIGGNETNSSGFFWLRWMEQNPEYLLVHLYSIQ